MATEAILRHRRDTAANWTSVNPVLEAGQIGWETDTNLFKFGDGVTAWTSLGYANAIATALLGAIIKTPGSSTRNTIYASGDFRLLTLVAQMAGTVNLFEAQNSALAAQTWLDESAGLHISGSPAASTGVLNRAAIGVLLQAYDAQLAALAALAPSADQAPYFTSSTAAALMTVTSFIRTLLDDTTQGAAQTTLGLVIGTNVQAQDARLAAIAAASTSADTIHYWTGLATLASTNFTAAARALLDDLTHDAMLATLGGGTPTGSGVLVRATSPTLVTPNLGTPSTLVGTNVTGIPTTGILDAAVTLAKQANLAQDTIIGRETASTGVPEAISHKATGRIICASTSIENLRQRIGVWRFWEEFVLGLAGAAYANSLGGSGNVYIAPHGYYAHHQGSDCQGILLATTAAGSAGTDVGCVYGTQAGMYLSDGAEFVFRISTNTATNQKCRFGLRSDAPSTSADVVNGAYFELDTATSTNWYACTAAASSRTKNSTGYSNSNTNATWQWFRIKFVSGASGVIFSHYAGGVWVDDRTETATIPTSGVNRQVRFFMQAIGNGSSFRDIACDGWGIPIPSAPPVPTA